MHDIDKVKCIGCDQGVGWATANEIADHHLDLSSGHASSCLWPGHVINLAKWSLLLCVVYSRLSSVHRLLQYCAKCIWFRWLTRILMQYYLSILQVLWIFGQISKSKSRRMTCKWRHIQLMIVLVWWNHFSDGHLHYSDFIHAAIIVTLPNET